MAARKRRRKSATKRKKRKGTKRKRHHKGHIPLAILERRARKLNRVVKSRGGSVS